MDRAATIKAAADLVRGSRSNSYDVALPFFRSASSLVWIVSKLLRDLGLNPIHQVTGSSSSDLARIPHCKIVAGFAPRLDVPIDYFQNSAAQHLHRWYGMPVVWTCFISPSTTDASLRAIASNFDYRIQRRAEQVIAANKRKIDTVIARYRPRLQNKLVIDFEGLSEAQLEPYRLLGMRIGNASGWPGKTGVWRVPRLVCDPVDPSDKAIDSYILEAKPDVVLYFRRYEHEWHKRGQAVLPFSSFNDHDAHSYWSYDGFACFAAALDRAIHAPWRKLIRPLWPLDSG